MANKYYFTCSQRSRWKVGTYIDCALCYSVLIQWLLNGKRKSITFAVPMVWQKIITHIDIPAWQMLLGFQKRLTQFNWKLRILIVNLLWSQCHLVLKIPSQFQMHATILKVTEYRCDNTENCKQDLARKSRQVHKIITYAWSVVVDTHPSSMPCNEIKMPSRLRDKKNRALYCSGKI